MPAVRGWDDRSEARGEVLLGPVPGGMAQGSGCGEGDQGLLLPHRAEGCLGHKRQTKAGKGRAGGPHSGLRRPGRWGGQLREHRLMDGPNMTATEIREREREAAKRWNRIQEGLLWPAIKKTCEVMADMNREQWVRYLLEQHKANEQ